MKDTTAAPRLDFVDRYRGFLITLVVVIHVSITYGASGSWYFSESHDVFWVKAVGSLLCALSQSFSLGAFFFLSAYFLPGSLARHGTRALLRERLVRLGIPFVVFYFILNPLLVMAVSALAWGTPYGLGPWFGSGPLWFVEALFIFTLVYVGARGIARRRGGAQNDAPKGPPGDGAILLYIVVAGALGFAARILFPIGWTVSNLQLGFFPMYIMLFAVGLRAGREGWLRDVATRRIGLWIGLAAAGIVLFPVALTLGGGQKDVAPFLGGLTWQNAVYAFWEALTGTSLFMTTLVLFARGRWRATGLGASFGRSSYGIYVLHAVVIIFVGLAMLHVPLHPALKWCILLSVGVCGSWIVTVVLKRIPGLSRIF